MEQHKALNSEYIIDGVRLDSTPAELLSECLSQTCQKRRKEPVEKVEIADESLDKPLKTTTFSPEGIAAYGDAVAGPVQKRGFELPYPEQFTRGRIAKALLDAIWKGGSFTLQDLSLELRWKWNSEKLGSMAAFRLSAAAAADYIYDLDSSLDIYSFEDGDGVCALEIGVNGCDDEIICPEKDTEGELEDWLIYVPFDTCPFRLGASVLAGKMGPNGDPAPEISDPDWFMDCYEVVREMVEDGIVTSGVTVCDGGIFNALKRCCPDANVSLAGLATSYGEKDLVRLLFAEVPGVILRIRDVDYDYIDSQMLLQDIAYYPLGHPAALGSGITMR